MSKVHRWKLYVLNTQALFSGARVFYEDGTAIPEVHQNALHGEFVLRVRAGDVDDVAAEKAYEHLLEMYIDKNAKPKPTAAQRKAKLAKAVERFNAYRRGHAGEQRLTLQELGFETSEEPAKTKPIQAVEPKPKPDKQLVSSRRLTPSARGFRWLVGFILAIILVPYSMMLVHTPNSPFHFVMGWIIFGCGFVAIVILINWISPFVITLNEEEKKRITHHYAPKEAAHE